MPQTALISGGKQVLPYPVEHEDNGRTALALTIRSAAGDDITSLSWNGDVVLTGPINDPGGPNAAVLMARAAAAAVASGFTARASGRTAYFMRDDGPRLGGYDAPVLVMAGTTSIVTAIPVATVVQDTRDGYDSSSGASVPADTPMMPPSHVLADAFDPDGGSVFEAHSHSIAQGSYVIDLATYTLHEIGAKTQLRHGARTAATSAWSARKFITRLSPAPQTIDWYSLEAIVTPDPVEWGEEHPVLIVPAFAAEGRIVNLDNAADAYVDGVAIKPGEFYEIKCGRAPLVVDATSADVRVEWFHEMEGY